MEWTTSNVPHRAKIRWNKENKWHKSITNQPIIHKYAAFTLSNNNNDQYEMEKNDGEKREETVTQYELRVSYVLKCDECLHDLPSVINDTDLLNTLVVLGLFIYVFCIFSIHFIFDWNKNERALLEMMSSTDDRWMPIAKVWTSTTELIFQFRTKAFSLNIQRLFIFFKLVFILTDFEKSTKSEKIEALDKHYSFKSIPELAVRQTTLIHLKRAKMHSKFRNSLSQSICSIYCWDVIHSGFIKKMCVFSIISGLFSSTSKFNKYDIWSHINRSTFGAGFLTVLF